MYLYFILRNTHLAVKDCIHESVKSPSLPLGASEADHTSVIFFSPQHGSQWLKAGLFSIVSATATDHAFN